MSAIGAPDYLQALRAGAGRPRPGRARRSPRGGRGFAARARRRPRGPSRPTGAVRRRAARVGRAASGRAAGPRRAARAAAGAPPARRPGRARVRSRARPDLVGAARVRGRHGDRRARVLHGHDRDPQRRPPDVLRLRAARAGAGGLDRRRARGAPPAPSAALRPDRARPRAGRGHAPAGHHPARRAALGRPRAGRVHRGVSAAAGRARLRRRAGAEHLPLRPQGTAAARRPPVRRERAPARRPARGLQPEPRDGQDALGPRAVQRVPDPLHRRAHRAASRTRTPRRSASSRRALVSSRTPSSP